MTKDVEPLVTINILAACDIPSEYGSSWLAFLELVLSTDSARTILCPTGLAHVQPIPPSVQGYDLLGKLA